MNECGPFQSHPLILAAGNGHQECIVLLLKASTEINKMSEGRRNALTMRIINQKRPMEDLIMLLYAAGEFITGLDVDKIPEIL